MTLEAILRYSGNAGSVVLYMAHGGTNFGFWAGANGLLFDITSYDYNAPIAEDGSVGAEDHDGPSKFKVHALLSLHVLHSSEFSSLTSCARNKCILLAC